MTANPPANVQLPSGLVAAEFGEVNVRAAGDQLEVLFTILMEPEGKQAEGWQTGVALDASRSMKGWYGRGLEGEVPPELIAEYAGKGWVGRNYVDGRYVQSFTPEGYADAIARGHLKRTTNIVEPLARDFIGYLADNLDARGGSTVIYWACGDGAEYEVLGDFTAGGCRTLHVAGPAGVPFGDGTYLRPALEYFVERFRDAPRGMYLFLTDGRLDDLEAVKQYTAELARDIEAGRRHMVKCVLIGVGDKIDAGQLEQLDDLETGTGVDVWDHKIAAEMRSLIEIFAEVVDENQIVAPMARIYDAAGNLVRHFTDGLPARVKFAMPAGSPWFELEVGGRRIRQPVARGVGSG